MTETEAQENTALSTETVTITTQEVTQQTRTKYGWVVLVASFLTQFLNPSIAYAAGIFHVALLDHFHDDVTLTAWVGALYSSMFALGGPLASLVTNMLDCRSCVFVSGILGLVGYSVSAFVTNIRLLFLTYALIAGLGTAFAQVASIVILGYHFPEGTAMTTGIVVCGAALGIFVHPPMIQFLLDWYGLTGTFLLVGAISSHCCILGLLIPPSKNEMNRKTRIRSGRTRNEALIFAIFGGSVSNNKLCMNLSFWMFLISTLFLAMGYGAQILFLPDYLEKVHHTSAQESSIVISFIGIGSLISRLCVGALGNDKRVGPEITYFSIIGITAIISLFLPVFAQGTGGRLAYGLLLGLYTGGVFALEGAIALQITGIDQFAVAFGAVMLFLGVGSFIGPPIAGSIYEATTNYNHVFICSAMMLFASSFCGFVATLVKKSRDHEDSSLQEEEIKVMSGVN